MELQSVQFCRLSDLLSSSKAARSFAFIDAVGAIDDTGAVEAIAGDGAEVGASVPIVGEVGVKLGGELGARIGGVVGVKVGNALGVPVEGIVGVPV
jgi:phage tail tape-measure protein